MNLYHDTHRGRLRWYVKISKIGRRIDITEDLCVPKSKSERIDDEVRPVWRANL